MYAKQLTYGRPLVARLASYSMSRVLPVLLLLGGVAYATPISIDQQDLPGSKPPASHSQAAKTASGAATADQNNKDKHPRIATDDLAASDLCVFTSLCYSTTKVPEPQSLVLVGTGLLSLAGFIRNRVIR
jgi:hypothetical protein